MSSVIRSIVPCNGCTACCKRDLIVLHPEGGDKVEEYETYQMPHSFLGRTVHVVKRKPNGDCIYLGDPSTGSGGCTIHERAPLICREFDCRKQFVSFTRNQRRHLLKTGGFSHETFAAGRARAHTLTEAERREAMAIGEGSVVTAAIGRR